MNFKGVLTIFVSKVLTAACRFVNSGGTSFPGKVAFKIYPDVIRNIAQSFKVILVTGTNGKTTTTKIIGQILEENGIGYITNRSGANLISGVATTLLQSVNLSGKTAAPVALIEIDEAAFGITGDLIEPDILVVTNFFRDQLDRYGELYTTLRDVKSGIEKLADTTLVLNADDSLCASLGKGTDKKVVYFGINSGACKTVQHSTNNDAVFCIFCKSKYHYSNYTYGHLGSFKCNNCGYQRPTPHIACVNIKELNNSYSHIQFVINGSYIGKTHSSVKKNQSEAYNTHHAVINLPGLYNVYNSLAAVACSTLLGLPVVSAISALGKVESGFGRMETIDVEGKKVKLILVKNPAGFNQVLDYILMESKKMQIAFLINDNLADGTDISWLWDVDFEKLKRIHEKIDNVYTSGARAEDMALRLKYAGIYSSKISIIKNYHKLINTGLSRVGKGHGFYILATYTAMFDIRKHLKDRFGLKEFWN